MICPLMSKPVTISLDQAPEVGVADIRYEQCVKEMCAWWTWMPVEFNGKECYVGQCVVIKIAEKIGEKEK